MARFKSKLVKIRRETLGGENKLEVGDKAQNEAWKMRTSGVA